MSFTWAAKVDRSHASLLGALRLLPNVEIGETTGELWLRGQGAIADVCDKLLQIPHMHLFHLTSHHALRPLGKLLTAGSLPTLRFLPIREVLSPVLPVAAIPAGNVSQVPIRLVRGGDEYRSQLIMTDLPSWVDYVLGAPEVRLKRWSFAAASDGRVVIRGEPVPPLAAQQYWVTAGVAIPVGFRCEPEIEGTALSEALSVRAGEIVLLQTEGGLERIPGEAFVRATRAAVRMTARVLSNEP